MLINEISLPVHPPAYALNTQIGVVGTPADQTAETFLGRDRLNKPDSTPLSPQVIFRQFAVVLCISRPLLPTGQAS